MKKASEIKAWEFPRGHYTLRMILSNDTRWENKTFEILKEKGNIPLDRQMYGDINKGKV